MSTPKLGKLSTAWYYIRHLARRAVAFGRSAPARNASQREAGGSRDRPKREYKLCVLCASVVKISHCASVVITTDCFASIDY
jgi:hypothetical protein